MSEQETWPNFFIVGAPKTGTTSLHWYLDSIPGIFMSKRKEPHYFDINTIQKLDPSLKKPIRDKTQYLDLFKNVKNEKIVGESSATYLADPEAPKLIYKVAPNAKIVMILRDPVERAYSHYLMLVRQDRSSYSFSKQLQIDFEQEDRFYGGMRLYCGFYFEQVKKFLDIFGKDQVKIIIFEEYIKDIEIVIKEILQFLEINASYSIEKHAFNSYAVIRGPISNRILKNTILSKIAKKILSTKYRKMLREKHLYKKQPKPKMIEEQRQSLIDFYRDDVKKLQELLGRDLPWKNF